MSSATMLKHSPDSYRLSPARVFNQKNRGLISSRLEPISVHNTTPPNSPTNLNVEDYRDSLIKQINNEKTRSRNGQIVDENLVKHEAPTVKNSWDSIYYSGTNDQLNQPVKSIRPARIYLEPNRTREASASNSSSIDFRNNEPTRIRSRNKHQHSSMSALNRTKSSVGKNNSSQTTKLPYYRGYTEPVMKAKTAWPKSSKPATSFLKPKSSPQVVGPLTKIEMPGLKVNIHNRSPLSDTSRIDYDGLQKFAPSSSTKSVRLPPNLLKRLNLKPQFEELARSYFYNPGCLSFTPMPIYEKAISRPRTMSHHQKLTLIHAF